MAIIAARRLTKKYGNLIAVNEIDFSVEEGEIFGFLGPNGAGKTTTINMLTGLARITGGEVMIDGVDCVREVKNVQSIIGVVPDESNLYDELSGLENLAFCAGLYGIPRGEGIKRGQRLLKQFDLADAGNKPFRTYSKGMKRKLTIAAGIIHRPRILFLDEPTTGIDVVSARKIRNLILDLNSGGATIFLTTHYIEEAERLCSRVAFIVEGTIRHLDTVENLLEQAREDNILEFVLSNNRVLDWEFLQKKFPENQVEVKGNRLRIHTTKPVGLKPFIDRFTEMDCEVFEARLVRPTLEDVLIKITGLDTSGLKEVWGE